MDILTTYVSSSSGIGKYMQRYGLKYNKKLI